MQTPGDGIVKLIPGPAARRPLLALPPSRSNESRVTWQRPTLPALCRRRSLGRQLRGWRFQVVFDRLLRLMPRPCRCCLRRRGRVRFRRRWRPGLRTWPLGPARLRPRTWPLGPARLRPRTRGPARLRPRSCCLLRRSILRLLRLLRRSRRLRGRFLNVSKFLRRRNWLPGVEHKSMIKAAPCLQLDRSAQR